MVLLTHEDWKYVWNQFIPKEQLDVIENKSLSPDERTRSCCRHYIRYCPTASWRDIARKLCRNAEASALEKTKTFLPPKGACFNGHCDSILTLPKYSLQTDSRFTIGNLEEGFQGFQAWDDIVNDLDIPESIVNQIVGCDSNDQKMEDVFRFFINDHPCPSWSILVESLESLDHYRLARRLRFKYIDTDA